MPPLYNVVNNSYPAVLRTGGAVGTKWHQTATGILWTPPAMQHRFYSNGPFVNTYGGHTVKSFELQNRSGGTASVGIGFRIANAAWVCGRYDGTTYTDITSSVQSAAGTATLGVDGADQTGFVVGCKIPFDGLSVNITTAEVDAGGAVDHTVQYSNFAGTAFVDDDAATTLTDNFTLTNTVLTAAVKNYVWMRPPDWGKSTAITGLPGGYYWLYVTTADKGAGDTAPIATGIELFALHCVEGVEDNNVYASEAEEFYCQYADGVVAYFSTAAAGNAVKAKVI